jgi:thiol-disulfide isomerase/thioredoxin
MVVALAAILVLSAVYRLVLPRTSAAEVKLGAPAPELVFTAVDGAQHRLSEFHGRPVMLWLFASWCPSCQAGTEAIARSFPELQQAGLQIVQLRLYQNLGEPGPSAAEFAHAFARPADASRHWLWGEASQEASYTFDPRGYPDVYFLIDKDGIIRAISGGPAAAIDQILSFARRGR